MEDHQIEEKLMQSGNDPDLRNYIGEKHYAELRALAEQVKNPGIFTSVGNWFSEVFPALSNRRRVYILPGIMGSTLWVKKPGLLNDSWVWINIVSGLNLGKIELLKYNVNSVTAKNAIELFYVKLKLSLLAAGYHADYLPYDWRLPVAESAGQLFNTIREKGETKVVLVCHSMGGLLARHMAALDPDRSVIQKVITVGTPNAGSYSPVNAFTLAHPVLQTIDKIDTIHSMQEIVEDIVRHLPGLLEMLPSSEKRPAERYFDADFWPEKPVQPLQPALTAAKAAKAQLPEVDNRFVQIIGMNRSTIQSASVDSGKFRFERSLDGDGTVPRDLAESGDIDRYYTDGEHQNLMRQNDVIAAIKGILKTGVAENLRTTPMLAPGTTSPIASSALKTRVRANLPSDGDLVKSMWLNESTGEIAFDPAP